MGYKQSNYSKYARTAIVCVMRYMNIQSFFSGTEIFFRVYFEKDTTLFVHQKDLFVRYGKIFQGEIAIRSRDIAINKKVHLECSDGHATHLLHLSSQQSSWQMYFERTCKAT